MLIVVGDCAICGGRLVDVGPRRVPQAARHYHEANQSPLCPSVDRLVEFELGYFEGGETATLESLGEQLDTVRRALLILARHIARHEA